MAAKDFQLDPSFTTVTILSVISSPAYLIKWIRKDPEYPHAASSHSISISMFVVASSRSSRNEIVEAADDGGPNILPSLMEDNSTPNLKNPRSQDGIPNIRHNSSAQVSQQLPSPSPSPSPRGLYPSSPVTDILSSEWAGISFSAPNGKKISTSFEEPITRTSVVGEIDNTIQTAPLLIPNTFAPHALGDIPEQQSKKPRKLSLTKSNWDERVLKLSAAEMQELTSAPDSLPVTGSGRLSVSGQPSLNPSPNIDRKGVNIDTSRYDFDDHQGDDRYDKITPLESLKELQNGNGDRRSITQPTTAIGIRRPGFSSRALSTPTRSIRTPSYAKGIAGQTSPKRMSLLSVPKAEPLDLNAAATKPAMNGKSRASAPEPPHSPMPQSIPIPPMSIPTYLQLELSSSRPSPLYIYRSTTSDNLYESSKIKFERLLNFLLLPPQLEQVLYFGSLACLDAWLYTFTILPLRFLKAAAILIRWWGEVLAKEARFISEFIYHGLGRMWHRQRDQRAGTDSTSASRSASRASRPPVSTVSSYQSQSRGLLESNSGNNTANQSKAEGERKSRQGWGRKHRRSKSHPSSLSSNHKADLLQGAVIICSCMILMKLDASRMYHSIRGQATMKLYVIYNVLEVCDRLFSALGQDIFECLFSDETLARDVHGRSKILRPLGMFILALIYNVIHAAALFYQVITLNVAVNSYSNALLTLLISNQFVEIKSTVFKKFEKDNLFQLTCADVIERFQLWVMLMIIAMRNIVEVGGLSILSGTDGGAAEFMKDAPVPIRSKSILPNSFTILPSWSGEVLSPFLLVLGSEMLVDWIKHAYISKFNCVKPAVYQRYLDVLAKDYYTNAFVNQNLIKRLGLPVIPLSCLFIRASVQTYNMFLATHLPPPVPSTATALSVEPATSSPATTAALEHIDNIIRRALGRSAFAMPDLSANKRWHLPSADEATSALTMLIFFLGAFLVLLACKLVLGMLLLRFARNRYRSRKQREHVNLDTGGKRVGGWGMVEVDDDKKRWIYEDDLETSRNLRERERAAADKAEKGGSGQDFGKISRYEMSATRIW